VFPDESAIAEAGWASQEASDLLRWLLRSMSDKGVVTVLDPRLATARNGGFLRASLPPFRTTYDPEVVRAALKRLDATQTP
jgi:ATP-dependent DNA helicase DinG